MQTASPAINWEPTVLRKGGNCPRCLVRIKRGDGKVVNVLQTNKGGLYCSCCERKVGEIV